MNAHIALLSLIVACTGVGCVAEPIAPPPRPRPPPVLDPNFYFYPTAGRSVSADQQERDKYECNEWAVRQTGFDPSNPQVPPHRPGAVTGAVVGAAVAAPWETGRGALLGAVAGAASVPASRRAATA